MKFRTREFKGSRLDALAFVWSENFERRHLDSSEAAAAIELRKRKHGEFAAEIEKMKAGAEVKRRKRIGRSRRGETGKQISPSEKEDRKTSTTLARAAGTNRAYLETAAKLSDKQLESIRDGKVKERQKKGQKAGGKARHGDSSMVANLPPSSKARDQAGAAVTRSPHVPRVAMRGPCPMFFIVRPLRAVEAILRARPLDRPVLGTSTPAPIAATIDPPRHSPPGDYGVKPPLSPTTERLAFSEPSAPGRPVAPPVAPWSDSTAPSDFPRGSPSGSPEVAPRLFPA